MMYRRRRLLLMAAQPAAGAGKLIIYQDGAVNPDIGELSNVIINGPEVSERSLNPAYIDNSTGRTGIYLGVASPYGGNQYAVSGAVTAKKITIPAGFTSVNAVMRGRSLSANNVASAGVNLWSASGLYSQNCIFPINDTYVDCNELAGVIDLSAGASEIGLKRSTYTADGWVAGDPNIKTVHIRNTGTIPAGDYFVGAYVRIRTSAYGSTVYGHSFIEQIWLE